MKIIPFISRFIIALALVGITTGPLSAVAADNKRDVQAAAIAPVNINTASARLVAQTLSGVGLKKAETIVAYRKKHGRFASFDDLQKVKGIGKSTVQKNKHLITFR